MLTVIKEELKIKPDSKTEIDVKDPSLSAQVVDHQEGKRFFQSWIVLALWLNFWLLLQSQPKFISPLTLLLSTAQIVDLFYIFHLLSMEAKVDYSLPNTVNNIIWCGVYYYGCMRFMYTNSVW